MTLNLGNMKRKKWVGWSVCRVMYHSFVTTAPPPTGKGWDDDFLAFSALL